MSAISFFELMCTYKKLPSLVETLAAEFFNTVENNQNTFFMNWSSALDRANAETPLVKVRKEGFWGIFYVGKNFLVVYVLKNYEGLIQISIFLLTDFCFNTSALKIA
jgi:hypothetical protein